jgi:hypothetical protein
MMHKTGSVDYFSEQLARAARIDFSDDYFQASGKGRNRIKRVLCAMLTPPRLQFLNAEDRQFLQRQDIRIPSAVPSAT